MGVPRLFLWIRNNYPEYITHFHIEHPPPDLETDHLHIDSNPFLYEARSTVFENTSFIANPYEGMTEEEKIQATLELYFELVEDVVRITQPTKSVYIALDGPAPFRQTIPTASTEVYVWSSNVNRSKYHQLYSRYSVYAQA